MSGHKYQQLIDYIESHWDTLRVETHQDTSTHVALPNAFIAPSVHRIEGWAFKEQFYWDSYFTMVGLATSGHKDISLDMVNNLLHLFDRFDYIPNSSNRMHFGRSQPPLLSSMVLAGYAINKDDRWLYEALQKLEDEYQKVWLGDAFPHVRRTHNGLSRYFHSNLTHQGAEDESGWDYTDRFDNRALDFNAIDLNALLFKYEFDIAYINEHLGHSADDWYRLAQKRKDKVNELMWNEDLGMYFDYDYVSEKLSSVPSLAMYTTMFVGLADNEQAQRLVENLKYFETNHGLTATAKGRPNPGDKQWCSPNGWAPLHFIVVESLRRYGYDEEAMRIARKFVATVNDDFLKTGTIKEKYNVEDPTLQPASAVYPDQVGFGWTNAVSLYFIRNYC